MYPSFPHREEVDNPDEVGVGAPELQAAGVSEEVEVFEQLQPGADIIPPPYEFSNWPSGLPYIPDLSIGMESQNTDTEDLVQRILRNSPPQPEPNFAMFQEINPMQMDPMQVDPMQEDPMQVDPMQVDPVQVNPEIIFPEEENRALDQPSPTLGEPMVGAYDFDELPGVSWESGTTQNEEMNIKFKIKCELCGNRYPAKSLAHLHELFHFKEERSLTCSVCNKKFAKRDALRMHMRNHFSADSSKPSPKNSESPEKL